MVMQNVRRSVRAGVTMALLACAIIAAVGIWQHYLTGPWTRDGQIQANVVNLAPEISGRIIAVHVQDNQTVHKGDILYEIEPVDYQVAYSLAAANSQSKLANLTLKQAQAKRRSDLTTLSTSEEDKQSYASSAEVAAADYAAALAQQSQARIDLERTKVVSPVDGYVTNLLLRTGDYATKGTRNLALLDSASFWAAGYFEETKLAAIHIGDPAVVSIMGYRDPVRGHVESLARGINTPNSDPGTQGLASVTAVFTWVRLAQRIPVRIHIDDVPASVTLAAGMTATITIGANATPTSPHGLLSRLASPS